MLVKEDSLGPPEVISELADCLDVHGRDFKRVGKAYACVNPPYLTKDFSIDEKVVLEKGSPLTRLDLDDQLMLLVPLSERLGTDLRFGTFNENWYAAFSPKGRKYVQNILRKYPVFTGEMVIKHDSLLEVRPIKGASLVSVPYDHAVSEGELVFPRELLAKKL